MNKKGVSPLIATVLLVMIVVSIGAAVMVVIQGLSEDTLASVDIQKELIKCGTDVEARVLTTGTTNRVCLTDADLTYQGNFSIFLENKGSRDIKSWRLTVVHETGVNDSSNLGSEILSGDFKGYRFLFDETAIDVDLIRLSPQITGGAANPTVTCEEPNLEWDKSEIAALEDCSDVDWDNNLEEVDTRLP